MKLVTSLTALPSYKSSRRLAEAIYLPVSALADRLALQSVAALVWLQNTLTVTSVKKLIKQGIDEALKQNLPSDDINTDFILLLFTFYATAFRSGLANVWHTASLCSHVVIGSKYHIISKAGAFRNRIVHFKNKHSLECNLCKCM